MCNFLNENRACNNQGQFGGEIDHKIQMSGDSSGIPEFKVVFVGNASVGKTSIIMRYHNGVFCEDRPSTIGSAFISRQLQTKRGPANLCVWDTAGQERYRSLVPMYSRGASVCVVVFDITDRESFEDVDNWIEKVYAEVSSSCKVVVAANKCDLQPIVERDELEAWSRKKGIGVIFVSAKTGENVDLLFNAVGDILPEGMFRIKGKLLMEEPNDPRRQKESCC